VTEAAAALLVNATDTRAQVERGRRVISKLHVPEVLNLRSAEGFAYYALHPLQYAAGLEAFGGERELAIVGIRSIGTTLSAVVAAAARVRGIRADRLTVRPTGHPYDRRLTFADSELTWVHERIARRAMFLVVDEGPGRSGSSFLATAEALERVGVSADCIVLVCSHEPDLDSLLARDAQRRWRRYKSLHASNAARPLPAEAAIDLSAGQWRSYAYRDENDWPAAWIQNERMKFVNRECRGLFKFEGYGRFGASVRQRAELVGAAGFGASPEGAAEGFITYEFLPGPPARAALNAEIIHRLACYCAFRASAFQVAEASSDAIAEMLACNLRKAFGKEPPSLGLPVVRPVIADGRMHPHEWVRSKQREWLKTDAASHGDDHFYPGPVDVAWDLAGCIIEWQMDQAAARSFLNGYTSASGDDARKRIRPWLLAYVAFRLGYSKMAAESLRGTAEEPRLRSEYARYRAIAESLIQLESQSARSSA
jgi:hypothetical protein